jgi:hypothetical protein
VVLSGSALDELGGEAAGNCGASARADGRELQAGLLNIKQNESQFSPPVQNAGLKLHVRTRCKVERLQLCKTGGDAKKPSAVFE